MDNNNKNKELNDFFNCHVSTAAVDDRLNQASSISEYLKHNESEMISNDLSDYLYAFLRIKDMSIADVARKSQLYRTFIYQIFDGRKKPSRDKLIAICFGLGLSDEETRKLMKATGYRELYVRDKRDSIILFALRHGKSIMEVDEMLYDYNLEPLVNKEQ